MALKFAFEITLLITLAQENVGFKMAIVNMLRLFRRVSVKEMRHDGARIVAFGYMVNDSIGFKIHDNIRTAFGHYAQEFFDLAELPICIHPVVQV